MEERKVEIRTKVFPTEDKERIIKSVLALFPGAKLQAEQGNELVFSGSGETILENVKREIERREIGEKIIKIRSEGKFEFLLNKQAACAGRFNFLQIAASPLGVIEVTTNWMFLEN